MANAGTINEGREVQSLYKHMKGYFDINCYLLNKTEIKSNGFILLGSIHCKMFALLAQSVMDTMNINNASKPAQGE